MIQNHINMIILWANKRKIKIIESKSVEVMFSLRNLDSILRKIIKQLTKIKLNIVF